MELTRRQFYKVSVTAFAALGCAKQGRWSFLQNEPLTATDGLESLLVNLGVESIFMIAPLATLI